MAGKRSDAASKKRGGDESPPRRGAAARRTGSRIGRRLIAVGALFAIAWFAIEGGEYGTSDLVKQRRRGRNLHRAIDSLTKEVDSLQRYRKALATDIRLQERIAREEFGMVRGEKEILYRFAEPADSSALSP